MLKESRLTPPCALFIGKTAMQKSDTWIQSSLVGTDTHRVKCEKAVTVSHSHSHESNAFLSGSTDLYLVMRLVKFILRQICVIFNKHEDF